MVDARVGWSKGTYNPVSRKVLILDMRRREEAEGESRMIGSERLLLTAEERGFEGAGRGRAANWWLLEA